MTGLYPRPLANNRALLDPAVPEGTQITFSFCLGFRDRLQTPEKVYVFHVSPKAFDYLGSLRYIQIIEIFQAKAKAMLELQRYWLILVPHYLQANFGKKSYKI